jgi:hypothetical protein
MFNKNVVDVNKRNGYDVDVFIHTWTETDHSTMTWHNPKGYKRGVTLTSEIVDEVKKYYAPKILLVEDQFDAIEYPLTSMLYGHVNSSYKTLLNFTYTVYKSSEIRMNYQKKNHLKYDYIIVTRPDILFYEPLSINNILSFYEKSNLNVPQNALFFPYKLNYPFIEDKYNIVTNDVIFFGTELAVNRGTDLYVELRQKKTIPELDKYFKDFVRSDLLWLEYWSDKKLEPIRIRYYSSSSMIRDGFAIIRYENYNREYQTRIGLAKKIIKNILPHGLVKIIEDR